MVKLQPNRVKHGMQVEVNQVEAVDYRRDVIPVGGTWEVLDRAPGGSSYWWLHRRNDAGRWESIKLPSEQFTEIAPRIDWDAEAPLNPRVRTGAYSVSNTDSGHTNVAGYTAGEYGAHKMENTKWWSITHIPTGLAMPAEYLQPALAEAKQILARLGELPPLFPGLRFGQKPDASHKESLNLLKSVLMPETVAA